jgi:hypothetical protein
MEVTDFGLIKRLLNEIFRPTSQPLMEPLSATTPTLLQFINETYKIAKISSNVAASENLNFIHADFLSAARRGHKGIAQATLGAALDNSDGVSFRSKAIAAAIKTGQAYLLSPFTGRPEPVHSSLGLEWYYHAADEHFCLASQMGATMVAVNLETVWVFPEKGLITYVDNGLSENRMISEIASLYYRCLSNAERLKAYLSNEFVDRSRPIALTDFSCPHMSHNLWNVQTAWANIFARCDSSGIKKFILFQNQNFFGDLEELFPEFLGPKHRFSWVKKNNEIFNEMLDNNLLLFTVKDEFFTKSFARRVLRRARAKCGHEFLAEVTKLKADASPLIITTVRLDNRAWIEQRQGLPALFSKLRQNFPRLGLIIDGLSSDTAKGWTTLWMSMEDELAVANAIKAALPSDMPVVFSVGRIFAESLILIGAADMFIAPSGSGMALYKWICNMPGLAFSNRSVLDETSPYRWPLRVWHDRTFRHDLVPTVHLPHQLVTDGGAERDHITRANFHLDWNDIYPISLQLLEKNFTSCSENTL